MTKKKQPENTGAADSANPDTAAPVVAPPCPQCGAAMQVDTTPGRRDMVRAMVAQGKSAAYAQNFADAVHEKRETLGPVATCGACRYRTRIAPPAPAEGDGAAA